MPSCGILKNSFLSTDDTNLDIENQHERVIRLIYQNVKFYDKIVSNFLNARPLCFISIVFKRTCARSVAGGVSLSPVSCTFMGNKQQLLVSHCDLNLTSLDTGIYSLYTLMCDGVRYIYNLFPFTSVQEYKRKIYNGMCVRRWVGLRSAATLSGSTCLNERRSEGGRTSRRHGTLHVGIIVRYYFTNENKARR